MKKAVIALYIIAAGQFIVTACTFAFGYMVLQRSFHDAGFAIAKQLREYGDSHYVLREPQP